MQNFEGKPNRENPSDRYFFLMKGEHLSRVQLAGICFFVRQNGNEPKKFAINFENRYENITVKRYLKIKSACVDVELPCPIFCFNAPNGE